MEPDDMSVLFETKYARFDLYLSPSIANILEKIDMVIKKSERQILDDITYKWNLKSTTN